MTRRDWLALFLALEGAPDGLDPVRIQNGLFLFAMQADVPAGEKYTFKSYDYGPMSSGIYFDLDALEFDGLVERIEVQGKSWAQYVVTDAGLDAGNRALDEADEAGRLAAAHALHHIKHKVAELPFDQLLNEVYDEYPEYATNSVFRRSA